MVKKRNIYNDSSERAKSNGTPGHLADFLRQYAGRLQAEVFWAACGSSGQMWLRRAAHRVVCSVTKSRERTPIATAVSLLFL